VEVAEMLGEKKKLAPKSTIASTIATAWSTEAQKEEARRGGRTHNLEITNRVLLGRES
jgi:hypothetical protein